MGARIDIFQGPDRDLGVDGGGLKARMAKHHLDEADGGAILQHQRRHSVAEQVTGAGLLDPGFGELMHCEYSTG